MLIIPFIDFPNFSLISSQGTLANNPLIFSPNRLPRYSQSLFSKASLSLSAKSAIRESIAASSNIFSKFCAPPPPPPDSSGILFISSNGKRNFCISFAAPPVASANSFSAFTALVKVPEPPSAENNWFNALMRVTIQSTAACKAGINALIIGETAAPILFLKNCIEDAAESIEAANSFPIALLHW